MSIFTKIDTKETEVRLNGESTYRLNRAIDYVHRHYEENLDLNKMAEIACLSPFHFHRQFNTVLGETPSEFIRRVRMEKAALRMMLEPYKPITQVASECGFSSSQNFSRSFKARYHANPSLLRKFLNWHLAVSTIRKINSRKTVLDRISILLLKRYLKKRNLSVRALLDEGAPTGIEIKKMSSVRVAYVRTVGAAYSLNAVKPAFQQLVKWAYYRGLIKENTFLRGAAWNNPDLTPADKLIYDVCIEVPDDVKSDEQVSVQTLPGGAYAVFRSLAEVRQHENRGQFIRLLYWLCLSDFRPEVPPFYNIYLNRAVDHPKGLAEIEVCIPVVPVKRSHLADKGAGRK